jgi:hypothetical protein
MAAKGIILKIGTEYTNKAMKSAIRDLNKLDAESKSAMSGLKSFGNNLKSSVGPALLGVGAAAAGFAVALGVDGIKSALAEQQQLAKLKQGLDNVGLGFKMPELNDFITKTSLATGVADDQLRPALSMLTTTTKDAAASQDLLTLALDISAQTGKDLNTVTAALSKGYSGNIGALGRLVPGLSDASKKSGDFSVAMGELQSKFAGAAAASADTLVGRMQILGVAFDEAKESFGTGFLEGLVGAKGGITDITAALTEAMPQLETFGRNLGDVVNNVLKLVGVVEQGRKTLLQGDRFLVPEGYFIDVSDMRDQGASISEIIAALEQAGLRVDEIQQLLFAGIPALEQNSRAFGDFAGIDLSPLRNQVVDINTQLNEAARARQIDLFIFFHGSSAPGVGITPALNDMFLEMYKVEETLTDASSSISDAAKKVDPFKAWSEALRTSAKKATAKAALMAKGLPAELADSVINMDGWKKVYDRLLKAGSSTIKDFIDTWSRGAEGQAAIGSQVDKITAQITSRLDKAKTAIEDFKTLSKDFAKSITDFGAISTFQPDAGVPITAMGITANVRQRLGMVREFASVLKQLQSAKVPLNNAALADIIGMGPFEGLPYAKALLEAGASTISGLNQLQSQFVTPANIIGNIGAEAQTGTNMAALQGATNFTVAQGGINITVNGEITAQTRQDIETAVTNAFIRVGRERRNARRAGV